MIATRFTADQLVLDEVHGGNGKAAQKCIELCKLLQHVYPDARFAVDGKHKDASNKVDYRGSVDVFVAVDGPWAGRIDVDCNRWASDLRYTFEGPYVDKGEARYWGDGKVWRKDPVKLVQAIQTQNCLRSKNPMEKYQEAREGIQRSAGRRLANLEEHASKLLRLSRDEAMRMALGYPPSYELALLAKQAKSDWKETFYQVQSDLEKQNADLAASLGIEPWPVHATNSCPDLSKVLKSL